MCVIEWLNRYRKIDERLYLLRRRLEAVREKAGAAAGPVLSWAPRGSGVSDPTAKYAILVDDIEKEIEGMEETAEEICGELEEVFDKMKADTVQQIETVEVMRLRYSILLSWDEVNETIFGEREDFEEKRDSYMRTVFHRHRKGVNEIQKLLKKENIWE